jgi:hypothetical protein
MPNPTTLAVAPENTATRTVAGDNQVTMDACAPDARAAVLPRAAAAF